MSMTLFTDKRAALWYIPQSDPGIRKKAKPAFGEREMQGQTEHGAWPSWSDGSGFGDIGSSEQFQEEAAFRPELRRNNEAEQE
jgi:hypothetical protein